jgi:site-specific recombinase XerD
MRLSQLPPTDHDGFPAPTALAALRAWYSGLEARAAVHRFLGHVRADGQSSRAMLSTVRRQLQAFAQRRGRDDLASLFNHPAAERVEVARTVLRAVEVIRGLPLPAPTALDEVAQWLPARAARALQNVGIRQLADLAPRLAQRRRWWTAVPGLGASTARRVEELLAQQPQMQAAARAMTVQPKTAVVPLERLVVPLTHDGSAGVFRAPVATCTLGARTDLEAVAAWLSLHETATTVRAYRKEAERLVLWALLERGKPISSLTTEDATAYRAFLRHPSPRLRWVGPARPRQTHEWRPFQGDLSPRSAAYALSVINALFRWLIEQRYLLANPFAGLKVKGSAGAKDVDTSRALTRHEWDLLRHEASLLDLTHGWPMEAAWRLRFMLDFWLATGLRPSELVGATLANVERHEGGDSWLHVRGKGDKPARVALPNLAIAALERYLAQRGLPVSTTLWQPDTPVLASLVDERLGVTTDRVRDILKRFFGVVAEALRPTNPALADKLLRATPHWLRHTHATLALAAGVDLKTVRDNLRHASIATTSVYLDADDVQRARQLSNAFPG